MKQSIELFSGSKHVSNVFANNGFSTFTIDYNPGLFPDLCCDIENLLLDCIPGSVHLFFASPDCSKVSRAAAQRHWKKTTISYRNYQYKPLTDASLKSVRLFEKTINLILELKPSVWFIENPIGRAPHLECFRRIGHYRYAVNYADWGFPYSKETYIFTNQLLPLPTSVSKRGLPGVRSISNSYQRSLIPPSLIQFLVDHSQF